MQLTNIEGEDVIWASKIYKEPPTSMLETLKKLSERRIYYAVTKSKAYKLLGNNEIIESCELKNAVITIVNRMKTNQTSASSRFGTGNSLIEVGDIVFIENGRIIMKLEAVENADLVVKLMETKKKSEAKSGILNPSLHAQGADEPEFEIWRYGPVYENKDNLWILKKDSMSFTRLMFKSMAGHIKAFYVVTNKNVKIISKDDESSVYAKIPLDECDITVSNRHLMPTKSLNITQKYAESYLRGLGKTYASMFSRPSDWTKDKTQVGDIVFFTNGEPTLMFRSIPNPDSLVDLINNALKRKFS